MNIMNTMQGADTITAMITAMRTRMNMTKGMTMATTMDMPTMCMAPAAGTEADSGLMNQLR